MTRRPSTIDLDRLAAVTANVPSRRNRILRVFVEEVEQDLEKLLHATRREAWQAAAHALKSSAAGVGAEALMACAETAQYLGEAEWLVRRAGLDSELTYLGKLAQDHARRLMA
jgi:HPt (histidine-containing phosphotransfer) domain-containing protein